LEYQRQPHRSQVSGCSSVVAQRGQSGTGRVTSRA
jgi:hypothetical protein